MEEDITFFFNFFLSLIILLIMKRIELYGIYILFKLCINHEMRYVIIEFNIDTLVEELVCDKCKFNSLPERQK